MDDEPSLQLGLLQLRVSGREFPDAQDFWDANWLSVEVRCETANSRISWRGPFLRNSELKGLGEQLIALRSGATGIAELAAIEPTLHVSVIPAKSGAASGHFSVRIELADDLKTEMHRFECGVDQSELLRAAEQIAGVLREFPIRG